MGLNQDCSQRTHLSDIGSPGEVAQGFRTGPSGADFKRHQLEFLAQIRMGHSQFLGNTQQRLIQAQSGFDRHDSQVESVRERQPDPLLAMADRTLEP